VILLIAFVIMPLFAILLFISELFYSFVSLKYFKGFIACIINSVCLYGLLFSAIGMVLIIFPVEILTNIFSLTHKTNALAYQVCMLIFFSLGFCHGILKEGIPHETD
jgi:hypothetical protein